MTIVSGNSAVKLFFKSRDNMENHRLTNEKLLNAQAKIERYENTIQQYQKMEEEIIDMKMKLNEFEAVNSELEQKKNIELTVSIFFFLFK